MSYGGEGDWLGARGRGGGGGLRNISSPLRVFLNIFRLFLGGAKFYGSILDDRSLNCLDRTYCWPLHAKLTRNMLLQRSQQMI
jgi:hypothetical protein